MKGSYCLSTEDGREWNNLTFNEFKKKCRELEKEHEKKAEQLKEELDAVTDVHTEIDRLLDLRRQIQETENRIKDLGYHIWKNSPEELFYQLRSKVFKALKLRLIAETPFFHFDPHTTAPVQEWLIPTEDEDKVREAIDNEYYRERRQDNDNED